MIDDDRLKVVDQLERAVKLAASYQVGVTDAAQAAQAVRDRHIAFKKPSPIEVAFAEERKRHTAAVLELQRDELLEALDEVRGIVDDRPKATPIAEVPRSVLANALSDEELRAECERRFAGPVNEYTRLSAEHEALKAAVRRLREVQSRPGPWITEFTPEERKAWDAA